MGSRAKQLRIGLGIFTAVAVVAGLVGMVLLAVAMHT